MFNISSLIPTFSCWPCSLFYWENWRRQRRILRFPLSHQLIWCDAGIYSALLPIVKHIPRLCSYIRPSYLFTQISTLLICSGTLLLNRSNEQDPPHSYNISFPLSTRKFQSAYKDLIISFILRPKTNILLHLSSLAPFLCFPLQRSVVCSWCFRFL